MPPYKLRLTPEQEARYNEVCANPLRRAPLPAPDKAAVASVDMQILKQVELYTREYREDTPYEDRQRVRNSLSRLRRKGLTVNTGTSQYPKWERTDAGNALLASKGL